VVGGRQRLLGRTTASETTLGAPPHCLPPPGEWTRFGPRTFSWTGGDFVDVLTGRIYSMLPWRLAALPPTAHIPETLAMTISLQPHLGRCGLDVGRAFPHTTTPHPVTGWTGRWNTLDACLAPPLTWLHHPTPYSVYRWTAGRSDRCLQVVVFFWTAPLPRHLPVSPRLLDWNRAFSRLGYRYTRCRWA